MRHKEGPVLTAAMLPAGPVLVHPEREATPNDTLESPLIEDGDV